MNADIHYISIAELVDTLGIGRTKAYELIQKGKLKAVKLGSRTLVSAESARAFVDGLPRAGGRS